MQKSFLWPDLCKQLIRMKSIKLLACLVTLQFTSGLTLEAADSQSFREWTDAKGRQITARLVETSETGAVKIERQDGQVFTVAVTVFSKADQAYVEAFRAAQKNDATVAQSGASASGPAVTSVSASPQTGDSADSKTDNAVGDQTPKAKFASNTAPRSGSGAGPKAEPISFFGVPIGP